MTSLRGGLAGCSAESLQLVLRARVHRCCELVAAYDPDPEALASLRDSTGIGLSAGSFDELLGSGVDFVVLAGDAALRLTQVRAAAEQGAHCLVLAPLAGDLATAQEMVDVCAKAGVRLGVHVEDFQDPVVDQLRRMVAADWLGGIVAVQGIVGDDDALRGGTRPGHPFVDLATRHLRLTSWLTGRRAVRVTAQTTRSFSRDDDTAVATAVLRGNVACTFTASHATAAQAFAVHGTDGGMRIAGDRLWLLGRREFRGEVFDYLSPGHELALSRAELAPALARKAPQADLLGRFARWIDDCDDFPCPGDAAVEDLRVAAAMLQAARSGSTEDV